MKSPLHTFSLSNKKGGGGEKYTRASLICFVVSQQIYYWCVLKLFFDKCMRTFVTINLEFSRVVSAGSSSIQVINSSLFFISFALDHQKRRENKTSLLTDLSSGFFLFVCLFFLRNMPLSATSTGAGAGGFAAPSNSNHKPSPPPVSILTSTVSSSLTTSPTHHHHHQQPQQLPQHPPSPLAQPQQQQSTASILGAAQSFSLVSADSMVAAAAAVAALHENNHHDSSATATRVSTTTAALAHSLLQPVAGGIIFNHNNTVEVPTPLSGANGSSNSMSNPTSGSQQRGVGRGSISTSSSGSAVYAPRFGSGVGLGGGVASTPLRSAGGAATAALPADIRQSLASLQYTIQCRASEVHEQLHSMAQLLETLMTTSDTNPQLHGTGGGGGGRGSSASSHKSSAEQESLHGSPHQQEPQKPQQQQRRGFSPGGGGAASSSPPITPNHNLTHVNPPPLMPVRVDGEAPSPPRVPHQPIAVSSSSVPGASSSQDGGNDAQRSASPRGRHLATFSPSLKPLQPVVSPQEAVKVPSPPPLPPSATTLGGGGEVDVKSPIRTVYANVAVTSVEAGRGGLDAAAVTEQTEKLRTVRPPAALVMSSSSSGSGNHPQANSNNSSNHNLGGAVTSTGQRLAAPLALRSPHHSLYSDAHNHTATANRALLAHLQLQLVDFVNAETAYQQALQGMIKSHERILVNATSSAVAAFGATAAMSGTTSLMMATSNTGSSSSPASPFLLQSPPAAAAAAAVAVATDQRNAGQSASSISATSYCSHNDGDDANEYLSRMMQLQQQQPAATPTTTPPHKDESVTTPLQQQQQRAPMTSFAPVTASYQPTLPSPPKRSHRSTSDRNLKHATGGGALVPIDDDDDDGPNQNTDAALLVTEGTSLTMPHNYNTHYTQNNNEASIELGFIPEDEDLYLLPSSSQPSASMIAHHQQQQQDMLTSISGGLFEALDHLRGMNNRAAVQLGSFRRRSRGPAAAMLQPSSSHQRSSHHHQIGAGGVMTLMMDFVDDDGELMECEQSIDVCSPALGLGEDAVSPRMKICISFRRPRNPRRR
ncbi:Hypothetical protein, putative [Bodo saltans]|uniref:Uncharacterized protein n=1 Tax=Bodo saltans TaxID=75058 RepID=A0A0S4JCL2_BODSA|nr:Hypothetical protein, putative [Bodo saltans]|eukprot:CUG88117.1 Hypothetical protein, putative [Bodo saltans]